MGKLLVFYLLASATGHPLLALVAMVAGLYVLDRGTLRWMPDVAPLFRRLVEQRRLEREIRINPHDSDARADLGRLLLERGRQERATELLEAALPKLGEVAEVRYFLGLALLRGSRWQEARQHLERSLEIDPHYRMGEARLRLGEYWARRGEQEKAREAFEAFLAGHESSVEGRVLAARALQRLGDLPAAREHLGRALSAYRSAPRFRRRLDRSWAWRARAILRGLP